MKMNAQTSDLLKMILNSNQNNHRLTKLKPFEDLPEDARNTIKALCESNGDRAHHAAGVLLYGFVSHGYPIAVVGTSNLDDLIKLAGPILPEGPFNVRSVRKSNQPNAATIWRQLWGLLKKHDIVKTLKDQVGQAPAVVEVVHPDWLRLIPNQATEELRLAVINSTSRVKFGSLVDYEASKLTYSTESTEATRLPNLHKPHNLPILHNLPSSSEHTYEHRSEQQFFKVDDIVECILPCQGLEVGKEYFVYKVFRDRGTIDIAENEYPESHFKFLRHNR